MAGQVAVHAEHTALEVGEHGEDRYLPAEHVELHGRHTVSAVAEQAVAWCWPVGHVLQEVHVPAEVEVQGDER